MWERERQDIGAPLRKNDVLVISDPALHASMAHGHESIDWLTGVGWL